MSIKESEMRETARRLVQLYKLGFAKQVRDKVLELTYKYCYGCESNHPSQTYHTCLMWTELDRFYLYRDEAYNRCYEDIATTYERTVGTADIPIEAKFALLELLLEKKLRLPKENVFKMVERMIKLEDRLKD